MGSFVLKPSACNEASRAAALTQHQRRHVPTRRAQRPLQGASRLHQGRFCCPSAAVASEVASTQLEDALSKLTAAFQEFKLGNLLPEHATRTKPELKEPIEVVKKHAQESSVKLKETDIQGYFDTGLNTTHLFTDEGYSTLGTLTFQQFGPKDLKIQIPNGNYLEQGVATPDIYATYIGFRIAEGEHKGVEGFSVPNGTYAFDEGRPYRQLVNFTQIKLLPRDSSPDGVAAWKAALKDANPKMGEDGTLVIDFPSPIHAWRDFAYVDDSLHITVGNRNNIVIVRRSDKPPITLSD